MPDFVTPCLFVDIGNVFENYDNIDLSLLRGSAGITFSAKLPVMQAKVSLSFGVPFNQGDEEYNMMSFGFGTMF
jgi:outer membrane protein assembly factor BamA